MRREGTGKLLRIFLDENDRCGDRPAYFALVESLRAAGFTGASVFKGIEGYGLSKGVRTARVFDLSTNLPVLVEVVEEEAKILAFLPALQEIVGDALVTLENLTLVRLAKDDPA
jgi:PII-like signaling protein